MIKGTARRHSLTEILGLLLTVLSTGTAIVCIFRMRRMENRFKSFQTEAEPPIAQKPAEEAGPASTPERKDAGQEEAYAPYESNAMGYDRVFMQRLDELIAENIMNHDMDVDFLADKMMISRSLLFSRVKRISGLSVTKYVNLYRIERSVEMLAQPHLSLTEIAESTGFSTLRYYSRVFKSIKGEIPSSYRKRFFNARP